MRTVDPFVGTRSIVWRGHAVDGVVLKDKGDAGRRKKRCHINTPRIGCILAQAHMSVGQSPGPVRHLGASEPSASREPRRHTINFLRSRLQETTSRLKGDSSMQINKYIEAGKENIRSPGTTLGIEGSVLLLRVQVHSQNIASSRLYHIQGPVSYNIQDEALVLARGKERQADPSRNLNVLMALVSSVAEHLPNSKPSLLNVQLDTLLDMVCAFFPH